MGGGGITGPEALQSGPPPRASRSGLQAPKVLLSPAAWLELLAFAPVGAFPAPSKHRRRYTMSNLSLWGRRLEPEAFKSGLAVVVQCGCTPS